MTHYATHLGASPGRGGYAEAKEAERLLDQCRHRINQLIGGDPAHPQQIIFTLNATDALNLAIRGLVPDSQGRAHVITTWLDHNSVLRPFNLLAKCNGAEVTRLRCDPTTGLVDPENVRQAIRPDTCLIAIVHGSNVTGTLQPISEIGCIAQAHDVPLLVDAAQTLGHVPVQVQDDHIDLLAFPGHKGLLGPLGTGGLYIRPGLERRMRTVRAGGTGSVSELDVQPDFLPDRFETGSHNAIGLIGLSEAIRWIQNQGVKKLWRHEQELIGTMIDGLGTNPRLTWFGPRSLDCRCGVFSVRIAGFDQPQILSDVLEREFGLLTRSGLHCAPLAHKTIGTDQLGGTTRLSFGPFLSTDDIRCATTAILEISDRCATVA